jgi:hypothetical protein
MQSNIDRKIITGKKKKKKKKKGEKEEKKKKRTKTDVMHGTYVPVRQ